MFCTSYFSVGAVSAMARPLVVLISFVLIILSREKLCKNNFEQLGSVEVHR
jgi:hypothetical protein